MFRVALPILLVMHGVIHLLGFFKAFQPGQISHITRNISVPAGIMWLAAALIWFFVTLLIALKKDSWWIPGIIGIMLSQVLIISAWSDARYGTIVNIIALFAIIMHAGELRFEKIFANEVNQVLQNTTDTDTSLVTENDMVHLPAIVQQYLRYTGVPGKPKVHNMRIVFEGEMRSRKINWFPFESVQYNTFDQPGRYFFMKGEMHGLTVPGYHRFAAGKASMDIRLFGLLSVAHHKGPIMDKSETVTLFNDMCLMAPAALIDKRITWREVDNSTAEATFTNNGISISARLYFDHVGKLINFESLDRYEINDMKQYPFYTPCSEYKKVNGYVIAHKGETVWQYPDTSFVYGVFRLKEIAYNVSSFKK